MSFAICSRLCVVTLAAALAACGGGSGNASNSSTTTSSSAGSSGTTTSSGSTSSSGTTSGGSTTSGSTGSTSSAATTSGVDCAYSESTYNATLNLTSSASWGCSNGERTLTANGIPDHAVGTFPNANNPNAITTQNVSWAVTLSPAQTSGSTAVTPTGYALNGVKFDPSTAGTCPTNATSTADCTLLGDTGPWNIEALGQSTFDFGVDDNNAHVQPNGAYHYHGVPTGILNNNGVTSSNPKMLLVGFAQDGFPIYARYGHSTATDATSALKVITSSYQIKTTLDSGRPSTSIVPAGTFSEDWEYVAGLGDLDACNGRFDVTPEFPQGIYHYYITDTYPYIQRCVYGTASASASGPTP